MTMLIPLREVSHLGLVLPAVEVGMADTGWLPVSHTELHLASLYFPIAVRFVDGKPSLGLILQPQYLKYPAIDPSGKWRGGYQPIALRCFPFQSGEIGADPLGDILIASGSRHLVAAGGTALVDRRGEPSPLIREIHRLFRLLREGLEHFADALDQLLIADLLVPLDIAETNQQAPGTPPLYVVDGSRFLEVDKRALGAMARHRFTALDIAVTCLSSQRLLRDQYRPAGPAVAAANLQALDAAVPPGNAFGLEGVNLVLDDGEMISLADIDAMKPA